MAALPMDDCASHEETICEDCRRDMERHTHVHIVEIGIFVNYVVPSFPVFEAINKLQHVKYTLDDEGTIFDGFVNAKDPCTSKEKSLLRLYPAYTNPFFIDQISLII